MKSGKVSRRLAVGALGVGAAAGTLSASAVARAARSSVATEGGFDTLEEGSVADAEAAVVEAEQQGVDPNATLAEQLVAPLAAGAQLARWTVEKVVPVENGVACVVCVDESSTRFQLDVCLRDDAGSKRGPGQTEHFEVFLVNSGNGHQQTFEDHGLAAMALAEVIRSNEQHVDRSSFSTHGQREHAARQHLY